MTDACLSTPVRPELSSVGGILLAAGISRRMGRNKMLLEIGGEPLVRRSARRALQAGIAPLIVVVGHEADRVREALSGLDCTFAVNPAYRSATSHSLHCGLQRLPADIDGAVVLLGDMVHVTTGMISRLRRTAMAAPNPLVASRYGEVVSPPHFFRHSLFPELLAWAGDGGAKAVALRHLHEALILDWPREALADLDTPDDLAALRETAAQTDPGRPGTSRR